MFAAFLNDSTVWMPVLQHPVLRSSLKWIDIHAWSADNGTYQLDSPGWYANVHGYTPLPETECIWENHLQTIDIQLLMSGNEGIRWASVIQLGTPKSYCEEKDRQEFSPVSEPSSLLRMSPGMFAIFMPGDAHCPKIALGNSVSLRKVVVKIPVHLLQN